VLDALPFPVCLVDSELIVFANSALGGMLQTERDLLAGRSFSSVSVMLHDRVESFYSEAGERPAPLLLQTTDGRIIPVKAKVSGIELEGMKLMQVSFIHSPDFFPRDLRKQILTHTIRTTRDHLKILALDGTVRWMNAESQRCLGIETLHQARGIQWVDLWPEEQRSTAQAALDAARAGDYGRFEGCFRGGMGPETWWDVSITSIRAQSSKVEALLVIAHNITDRKKVECELVRRTRHLQMIVDKVPALIAYIDVQGCYQWANRAYEEWYGLSSKDMVGRYWYGVISERVGKQYARRLRPKVRAALAGVPQDFEATHAFGGQERNLHLSYTPDRDENGCVRGFVLLATDMTEQRRAREDLLTSQESFRTLAEALPSIVWSAKPNGALDYLSDRFCDMTGLLPEEGLESKWIQTIHPDDLPDLAIRYKTAMTDGTPLDERFRIRQKDGSYRWYLARALPQRNDAGEIIRWVGASTDIHQQVLSEEAIRRSEQKYRLLFDDNPLPMWTYDCQTLRFISVNDKAIRSYGYSREEFLSMRVTDIRPKEDLPRVIRLLRDPRSGVSVGPFRHKRKDGSIFWAEVTGHDISQQGEDIRLVVAQDVSERVRLNEELLRRAEHDPLTGLPNRILLAQRFYDAARRADQRGSKAVLLAIDFDHFKQINDSFGHQVGDGFLKALADRLRRRLRSTDTLARLGGDEFIAIADDVHSLDACTAIASNLIDALQEPITVMDVQLQPTISLGLAVYPDDGANLDDLMRRADYGLYEAKRAGRNCWRRYMRTQSYGVEEARQIERSLRTAADEQRLMLHYQPMFSPSGEIKAMEALIRLIDPQMGILPPGRFISIAEETGLIHSIGMWVLREACRQSREWRDQGFDPVPLAINVSAPQFLRGNLAVEVQRALDDFQMEPALLELELTESLLMENTEQARQQLSSLRALGVRISMDDFGTGYSSLSYLQTLPIDTLKIDQSFVHNIDGPESYPIVKAIVELGKNLGLTILAEGVETKEQHEELVRLGCDLLQGFLLSPPQPAHEIQAFLEAARPFVPAATVGRSPLHHGSCVMSR
jgi:diguanylate cyclase (GGDEF)-like protein/PAS domain S-box-containing protein